MTLKEIFGYYTTQTITDVQKCTFNIIIGSTSATILYCVIQRAQIALYYIVCLFLSGPVPKHYTILHEFIFDQSQNTGPVKPYLKKISKFLKNFQNPDPGISGPYDPVSCILHNLIQAPARS